MCVRERDEMHPNIVIKRIIRKREKENKQTNMHTKAGMLIS